MKPVRVSACLTAVVLAASGLLFLAPPPGEHGGFRSLADDAADPGIH